MMRTPAFELWNLSAGGDAWAGAQDIFNVVGRVADVAHVRRCTYVLNEGSEREFAVRGLNGGGRRLERPGDFNIDTIRSGELREANQLELRAYRHDGNVARESCAFRIRSTPIELGEWRCQPRLGDGVESLGQVVDGRWTVGADDDGRGDVGSEAYDAGDVRILLFGYRAWPTGYELHARFVVERWTRSISQGVGGAFKWNDHAPGDGSALPETWSTGMAWAFSESPGATIRFGVDARKGSDGRWRGESVLAEASLSRWRAQAGRLCRRVAPTHFSFPPVRPGVEYRYRLVVDDAAISLTIWENDRPEPRPQVVARGDQPLPSGSVGWVAHYCAMKLYELLVIPVRRAGRVGA